jgi:hypothetical protein
MKRTALLVMGVMLFMVVGVAKATLTDIYDDMIISEGTYGAVNVHDDAVVSVVGTDVSFTELWTLDTSVVNFENGSVGSLFATVNSRVNLYQGDIDTIKAYGVDSVHIYGSQFSFVEEEEIPSRGILTFFWENDVQESIYLRDCPPYYIGGSPTYTDAVVLHEIPEPATISILLLGIVGIKKHFSK